MRVMVSKFQMSSPFCGCRIIRPRFQMRLSGEESCEGRCWGAPRQLWSHCSAVQHISPRLQGLLQCRSRRSMQIEPHQDALLFRRGYTHKSIMQIALDASNRFSFSANELDYHVTTPRPFPRPPRAARNQRRGALAPTLRRPARRTDIGSSLQFPTRLASQIKRRVAADLQIAQSPRTSHLLQLTSWSCVCPRVPKIKTRRLPIINNKTRNAIKRWRGQFSHRALCVCLYASECSFLFCTRRGERCYPPLKRALSRRQFNSLPVCGRTSVLSRLR